MVCPDVIKVSIPANEKKIDIKVVANDFPSTLLIGAAFAKKLNDFVPFIANAPMANTITNSVKTQVKIPIMLVKYLYFLVPRKTTPAAKIKTTNPIKSKYKLEKLPHFSSKFTALPGPKLVRMVETNIVDAINGSDM
jgi:hypothetical protein